MRVDRHFSLAAITSLALGFGLLLVAWVMATQPFAAPDEPSHYLRALSIANGHLLGAKVPYPYGGLMPAQLAWVDQGTRAVWVPAGLSPPVPCIDHKPNFAVLAPGCREASEVGNYHPLPYLLPALALDVSNDSTTGLYLSRLASAIPCLAFILLAFALLWDGSAWSLLGPLGAITPMVLFISSIVNPNGLELAACLAFAASVLRIARVPSRPPSWVWAAFALSGAAGILAWQLGPVFVLADLALGAALLGPRGLRTLRISEGRRLALPALTLTTATALYLVYGVVSGVAHSTFGISPIRQSLHQGLSQLVPMLGNSVGTFGSLTVPLPFAAYRTWWLLVGAIICGAMWVGSRRERSLLAAVVVLVLAFPVLFFAWVYRFTGFAMQGALRAAGDGADPPPRRRNNPPTPSDAPFAQAPRTAACRRRGVGRGLSGLRLVVQRVSCSRRPKHHQLLRARCLESSARLVALDRKRCSRHRSATRVRNARNPRLTRQRALDPSGSSPPVGSRLRSTRPETLLMSHV